MGFLDSKEKKAGFYTTVIFHLVVIIICLLTAIQRVASEETSFVLDFSQLEELEEKISIINILKHLLTGYNHFEDSALVLFK